MCIFELILSIHFSNIFQNNFAAAWRTIKFILLNCWCISLLQHPANVISELSVYTVADRTDNWRVIRQLWMLSDWNQWTEVLTVTRWICQQPMMTSTCSGFNNSVSSLSCSSSSDSGSSCCYSNNTLQLEDSIWGKKLKSDMSCSSSSSWLTWKISFTGGRNTRRSWVHEIWLYLNLRNTEAGPVYIKEGQTCRMTLTPT